MIMSQRYVKKQVKKINVLVRILNYTSKEKLRMFINAFFNSQFGYCPLVWILRSQSLNNGIDQLQERALRLVYDDNAFSLREMLKKRNNSPSRYPETWH